MYDQTTGTIVHQLSHKITQYFLLKQTRNPASMKPEETSFLKLIEKQVKSNPNEVSFIKYDST